MKLVHFSPVPYHRAALAVGLVAGLALFGCHSKSAPPSKPLAASSNRTRTTGADHSSEVSPPGASQDEISGVSTAHIETGTTASDARPVLVCFGDSLTAGYGTDPGQSYPDDLQRDLDKLGYRYRVVNSGVSGNTTKDGLDRLKDVLRLKPAVAIVAFGGNDGLRGLPIATSRANLESIVATLKQAGIKVVLGGITLPPNFGPDYVSQFNDTYRILARKYNVPLMPFILQGVYGVPGSMQADGIHATSQGNTQVALNLLPLVRPFLKKP